MASKDFYEAPVAGEVVWQGRLLQVHRDQVRLPDGRPSVREYIRHPGAVVILALDDHGNLLLERQFRYPLGREFIELPAGKIDPGETPAACARRELLEETGYTAREWCYVTTVYPCIGYADERLVYFLARGLIYQGHRREGDEFLEVFTLPVATAISWVQEGRICEAKTVAGLFWLEKLLAGAWTPQSEPPAVTHPEEGA
ncbi:NUDIX hydrolase [Thiobacter aerophilum]|uniref:GDP-mannose pyrophosphatase n=1 Tax=Thiobacter aerophilum TaxID=3121275 RepID=A0ABV0EJ11_9BURK